MGFWVTRLGLGLYRISFIFFSSFFPFLFLSFPLFFLCQYCCIELTLFSVSSIFHCIWYFWIEGYSVYNVLLDLNAILLRLCVSYINLHIDIEGKNHLCEDWNWFSRKKLELYINIFLHFNIVVRDFYLFLNIAFKQEINYAF